MEPLKHNLVIPQTDLQKESETQNPTATSDPAINPAVSSVMDRFIDTQTSQASSVTPPIPTRLVSVLYDEHLLDLYGKANVDRIMQVTTEAEPQEELTQKTTSPSEFLAKIDIEQMEENPFTQADLEQIYGMMEKYPMCAEIPFYFLFGLETFGLLQTLESYNNFLSLADHNNIMNRWAFVYIKLYDSTLFTNNHSTAELDSFTEELKIKLKTIVENKRPQINKSDSRKTRLQNKFYNTEQNHQQTVTTFLEKWNKSLILLKKFLAHKQSQRLLNVICISECLGTKSIMRFSSFEEIQNAILHLRNFTKYINRSFKSISKTPTSFLNIYDEITKEINSNSFDINNIKGIKLKCRELYKLIHTFLFKISTNELSTQSSGRPVVLPLDKYLCFKNLVQIIHNILTFSIIPFAYPQKTISENHQKRILFIIYSLHNEEYTSTHYNEENNLPWFDDIYKKFNYEYSLISKELVKIHETALFYTQKDLPVFFVITDDLKAVYEKLKPLAISTLGQLCEYVVLYEPAAPHKLPLVEMTKTLARILIMIHDMEMLLYEKSPWPCELPEQYLDLVCLEADSEENSEVEETLSHIEEFSEEELTTIDDFPSLPEFQPLDEAFPSSLDSFDTLSISAPPTEIKILPGFSLETTQPPKSQSSKPQTVKAARRGSIFEPHKPMVEESSALSQNSSHTTETSSLDYPNLNVKKVRKLRQVLNYLGIKPIRGKKHDKMVYSLGEMDTDEKKVATVMGRHGGRQDLKTRNFTLYDKAGSQQSARNKKRMMKQILKSFFQRKMKTVNRCHFF